ncbi:phosphopentomutase [Vibrio hepatarius]|uniref:phosphopentomutase n=1 Tax=Vibrio hepatarius TaxID=171383 RepID=UPI00142DC18E|nr:phosphopentomutase [Vibrio hepatarius]NIY84262.1 phosphopentomutase [Vibrio hepatarius]
MARFIVVVLDGFGVGEMPDVAEVRSQDCGANTASKLFSHFPLKRLPMLEALGLQNVVQNPDTVMKCNPDANVGIAELAHQGGDTFMGHQEIMGTCPKPPLIQPFQQAFAEIERVLQAKGYKVERIYKQSLVLLLVEDGVVIGDNLEADLGQVYNLTCNFNVVSFDKLRDIADVVREANPVSRNIAFGGNIESQSDPLSMQRIFDAIEIKNGADGTPQFIGVNAPDSGAYENGFQVMHLGYGVDAKTQVPWLLHQRGVATWLYGKVADIVQNPFGRSYLSVVDTDEVFRLLNQDLHEHQHGFFCANVQETDLSGHQQDPKQFWRVLEKADKGLASIIEMLNEEDVLIVMADHGNDPFIGHTKHTREQVPVLAYSTEVHSLNIGQRKTLSDVGATVCAYFSAELPENGTPIKELVDKQK